MAKKSTIWLQLGTWYWEESMYLNRIPYFPPRSWLCYLIFLNRGGSFGSCFCNRTGFDSGKSSSRGGPQALSLRRLSTRTYINTWGKVARVSTEWFEGYTGLWILCWFRNWLHRIQWRWCIHCFLWWMVWYPRLSISVGHQPWAFESDMGPDQASCPPSYYNTKG